MAFFDYIVSMSIRACVLVPLAVVVRALLTKYPKRYSYALWLIVFAGIIVKISLPVAEINPAAQVQHSIQQQYNEVLDDYVADVVIHHDNTEEYAQAIEQGIQPIISEEAKYVITAADSIAPPKTVKTSVIPKIQIVWIVGVLALLVVYIRNVLNMFGTIRFATHYKYDIYYSENIASPFVFGIIKPKIYLPYSITAQQAEHVIAHERVHIKRLDYIVKPLCLFITILHWFNPLVWLAFWLMNKDMEFSCDEAAVDTFDTDGKKDYCTALVQFALKDESYRMSTVMFGESDCSRRIKNLLASKRPYKLVAEMLVLVVLATAIGCTAEEKEVEVYTQFENMTFAQLEEYKKGQPMQSDDEMQERIAIAREMDRRDDAEIAAYLAEFVKEYCVKDSFVKLKEVSVVQDHLTIVRDKAQKPLRNAAVTINLELYPYSNVDIKTEAEEYCRNMYNYMCGEYKDDTFIINLDFIASKTNLLQMNVFAENGGKIAEYTTGEADSFENPTIIDKSEIWVQALPQTEEKAVGRALSYGSGDMTLKKFGIKGDSQLYVEYFLEDSYLLKGDGEAKDKIAQKTAQLNDVYADICEKIIRHSDVQEYITANSLETAVIVFSNRFLENEKAEFPFTLADKEFIPDYDITVEDSLPGNETSEEYEEFLKDIDSSQKYYTEDGIPIDEIKQHPGHIAVVPQEEQKTYYYTAVTSDYFTESLFIGDSFADGFRVYDTIDNAVADKSDFITYNNMTPQNFISELDDLEHRTGLEKAASFDPYSVYIMMGTDALVFISDAKFISEYESMIGAVKAKMPEAKIYVCSVPPVSAEQAEKRTAFEKENLAEINGCIAQIAEDNGAYYLNLHEILADESGYLSKDYDLFDGIHIYSRKYSNIIDYLRTHVAVEAEDLEDKSFTRFMMNITSAKQHFVGGTASEKGFVWPTEEDVRITRGFAGAYPAHDGLDIAGPLDTEIYAAADGTVDVSSEGTTFYGNYIIINHGNGLRTLYAHCNNLLVKEGETVTKGELIATMGATGNSTGVHLHFGVSQDYIYVNPLEYLTLILEECKQCTNKVVVTMMDFSEWEPTDSTNCAHNFMWGYDLQFQRTYTSTYACQNCGHTETVNCTEVKTECHGF